jgi:predicted membrane protein
MKFLVYGVLFIIAAALIIGLVIGVAFELIGLLFSALIVVAVVTFVMNKVRGPGHRERLRGPGPTERLR